MTVDIHPEDLIDKLTDGEITAPEAERLRAHLAVCSSCRFELSVRSDFLAEMPAIGERPQLGLGASVEHPSARLEPRQEAPLVVRAPRRGRRLAWLLVAAAFVTCAGGAAALNGAGVPILPWMFRDSQKQTLEHAPSSGRAASATPKRLGGLALAHSASRDEPAPAESAELGASAELAPVPAATPELVAPGVAPVKSAPPRSGPAVVAAPATAAAAAPPTSIDFSAAIFAAAPSSGSAAPEPQGPPDDAAALFSQANRARRDGNSERAELLYRSLQARFPGSPESELSREVLAQMLLERGNAAGALAGFDRYLADGSSGLAAEALVGRARALEQLGQREQAAAAWRAVATRYPGTVHASLAAKRLATLDPE